MDLCASEDHHEIAARSIPGVEMVSWGKWCQALVICFFERRPTQKSNKQSLTRTLPPIIRWPRRRAAYAMLRRMECRLILPALEEGRRMKMMKSGLFT
jgi:hypothetical protein